MCEKVSIYKGFRAFEKLRSENRLHAPQKHARYRTAPHPEKDPFIIAETHRFVKRDSKMF
jgi:hypothetical protein